MADNQIIEAAKEHFGQVVAQQLERVERLKNEPDWVDYSSHLAHRRGNVGRRRYRSVDQRRDPDRP